ncbi:ABC transporter permease [Enterococcus ureilyticus]|uniref:ABC transporter permease n=1 Tax=Enterococcus ureilyticus TaxID=1131292 RepID=A0A1E5HCY6_9ENTE|nr:MptD family putative ECF transporter S component [Enterococcus ureilyticus]MBM7687690.1 energy-coupling factor transport system substrate-specific component [Enterococcus ureilyticus]OEG22794.1 ABC transporter permease [Enterococcus ureilyticus]
MKKLKIQDFISVGIYTAIYFLVVTIAMVILRFTIPAFNSVLIPSATALFAGIVYLLVLHRIPRFGAITIMGSVMGLFFLVSGHFPLSFLPNIVCAVAADWIQYRTKLSEKIRTLLSYTVFSFGLMGPVLPLWFMKNAYVDSLVARGKDTVYIDKVFAPITTTTFYVCVVSVILCSIVGLLIGQKIYEKHFDKTKGKNYGKNIRNV